MDRSVDAGDNFLYRGQTKHYGGLNSPAIMTSFDRHGCIPPKMMKWSYYAHGALKYALGHAVDSMEFVQAVLQHYGWRSFYLDLTSRPTPHLGLLQMASKATAALICVKTASKNLCGW